MNGSVWEVMGSVNQVTPSESLGEENFVEEGHPGFSSALLGLLNHFFLIEGLHKSSMHAQTPLGNICIPDLGNALGMWVFLILGMEEVWWGGTSTTSSNLLQCLIMLRVNSIANLNLPSLHLKCESKDETCYKWNMFSVNLLCSWSLVTLQTNPGFM